MTSLRTNQLSFPSSELRNESVYTCSPLVAAAMLLTVRLAPAQEALQSSLRNTGTSTASPGLGRLSPDSMPYTFKAGDFRLLASPSFGASWNDNVNTSKDSPE